MLEQDTLTPRYALSLLEQMLATLRHLAASGFIHGWLTPRDLGVMDEGVLIDPLVMNRSSSSPERRAYAAPEMTAGTAPADGRADIYTMGVITYRMLLGQSRFDRVVEHSKARDPLTPLSELQPELPASIAQVIERMVSPVSGDRFETAVQAHAALTEALDVSNLNLAQPPPPQPGAHADDRPSQSSNPLTTDKPTAESELRVHAPVDMSAPERTRSNRSALPAFITVAILLLAIGGAWYWWQFIYQRQQADTAISAVEVAREAAQDTEARVLALGLFARAEQKLSATREAYDSYRYGSAKALAETALVDFVAARHSELERGVRQALQRTVARYEDAARIDGVNMGVLKDYWREIQALDNALDNGVTHDAKSRLGEIEHLIAALVSEAHSTALARELDQVEAEVNAEESIDDNGRFATNKRIEAARIALDTGDTASALTNYEKARELFQAALDQAGSRALETLKTQTGRTRQTAITAGAERLPRFAQAEREWQTAMQTWESRKVNESESAFTKALGLYESLLLEEKATRPRTDAKRAHDLLTPFTDLITAPQLARGELHFSTGKTQLERQDYLIASASFTSAATIFRELLASVQQQKINLLHSEAVHSREQAKDTGNSAHYREGERILGQARTLMESGEHPLAGPLLEQARSEFDLAIEATQAITSERALNRARESAASVGLTMQNAAFARALALTGEGQTAFAAGSYDNSREYFSQAIVILEQATQDVIRSKAEQEHKRSLVNTAEAQMRDTLTRALSVGVSGELGELAVGHSHRQMGETLRDENDLDAARSAFDAATKAFEQAILVEIEIRALRARDAAVAVRRSAAGSGAARLERFTQSNDVFDTATVNLAQGDHEVAYETFKRAQAGFDQAAVEWAARVARAAADEALAQARAGGVSNSDSTLDYALRTIERAQALFSREAFAEAAELFVITRQTLETLVEDRRTSEVMDLREQALAAKNLVSTGHDLPRFIDGDNVLSKADNALQAGELDLAVSRFKAAKDQFEVALVHTTAVEAQTLAATSHAAASAMGARNTDPLFVEGNTREQAGITHLQVLRFAEARQMFDQARERFDRLRRYLEEQTKTFLTGSTPAEIARALALCDTYVPDCQETRYTAQAPKEVRLRPFAIDDHEVTNEEFAEFVRAENYQTDAERLGYSMRAAGPSSVQAPGHNWRNPGGRGTNYLRYPTHPVVHVSFNDARAYCRWSGGRLPDEAEWEYAARGEPRRQFPWGDVWQADIIRWGGEPAAGPMPVRTYPASATPEGVHDLTGNVWEWTRTTERHGVILKGGSWLSRNPANLRAAARLVGDPEHGRTDYGFRCVWDLDAWP